MEPTAVGMGVSGMASTAWHAALSLGVALKGVGVDAEIVSPVERWVRGAQRRCGRVGWTMRGRGDDERAGLGVGLGGGVGGNRQTLGAALVFKAVAGCGSSRGARVHGAGKGQSATVTMMMP